MEQAGTQMCQQSESGCHSCQHLRRLSVRSCRPAKRLYRIMGPGFRGTQTAYGDSGTLRKAGNIGNAAAPPQFFIINL